MRDFIRLFAIFIKLFLISVIIISCESTKSPKKVLISDKNPLIVNKKLLSRDTYDTYTQYYTNSIIDKIGKSLFDNSLIPLYNMNLFVWKIGNGENMNKKNKFSIILEDKLKSTLQVDYKVNVFNLEKISSRGYKKLLKTMNIPHILSGTFHTFRDGVSLSIKIMTVRDSKIIASSSVFIKKSFYERVMNIDYVGEDTDDEYFMKLKARK